MVEHSSLTKGSQINLITSDYLHCKEWQPTDNESDHNNSHCPCSFLLLWLLGILLSFQEHLHLQLGLEWLKLLLLVGVWDVLAGGRPVTGGLGLLLYQQSLQEAIQDPNLVPLVCPTCLLSFFPLTWWFPAWWVSLCVPRSWLVLLAFVTTFTPSSAVISPWLESFLDMSDWLPAFTLFLYMMDFFS